MALVTRWDEARLLWDAKGWSIDEVAEEVQKQVAEGKWQQLADLELSESTVARRTRTNRGILKGLGEFVEELGTKPGRERETDVVEAGLRVLRGQPLRSKNEPQKIAQALLAVFPANELALRLVDALLAQAQIASGNGSLLDVFAQAIAGRLPHLDTAKLARIVAKRIAHTLPTLSLGRLAFVAVVASAVACGAWFLLDQRRGHVEPRSTVLLVASPGPSGAVVSDPQDWLSKAIEEMGEKPSVPLNQPVPLKPFPGQKVPPCDTGYGESDINGGCWANQGDVKPPCGRLYQSGDKCYRPIAADPQKPVSGNLDSSRKVTPGR